MDKLKDLFESYTGQKVTDTEEINSSGSNRRYFRLKGGNISVIGVVGNNLEENNAFVKLARHFIEKGIRVPKVLSVSEDGMRYIQEDLGDDQLYKLVSHGRESGEYSSYESMLLCRTMEVLPKIQFKGAQGLDWSICYPEPAFNQRMVMFDLNYFKYCFLKATGLEFNETRLQDDLERLKDDLMKDEGCETFMYRDFQARNVMVKDGEPYFIDFQGGRRGPIYYDVASFIWQARSRYPENLRKEMVQTYLTALKGYTQVDEAAFHERLRLFILFRTLQVLGAYGFRGYFEKKPHFLASVPYALSNLRKLLQKPFVEYPYLNEILTTLATMPQFNNIAEDKRLEVRIFSFAYKKGIPVDTTGNGGGFVFDCRAVNNIAEDKRLEVRIFSFAYKKGIPVDTTGNGGGFVFDCRAVNNPGKYEHYRQFTGLDPEVVKFLEDDGGITKFLDNVYSLVDTHVKRFMERKFTHMQVCFGCTGGQHRSVYCAERLASHLSDRFDIKITVSHRELDIERIL